MSNTTQRLRRERAHGVDVLDRDVVARHHDDVELGAARGEQVGDRARHTGVNSTSMPRCCSCGHVRLPVLEVVGDERHLAAQRRQDLEDRLHAQRARILVGRQHARVDDEHAPLRPAVVLESGIDAVGAVRVERRRPLVGERRLIDDLVPLDAGGLVGAGRLALEMDDGRQRLVVHLAAGGAHGEGEIDVLVIRRRVARVEAAELAEQRGRDREARAGAVVDFAQVVVLGLVGIVVAAAVPRRAVAPDDAARLLQAAVRDR